MTKRNLFWVIMLLWVLFGCFQYWPLASHAYLLGNHFILWVLLALLGWQTFGRPIE